MQASHTRGMVQQASRMSLILSLGCGGLVAMLFAALMSGTRGPGEGSGTWPDLVYLFGLSGPGYPLLFLSITILATRIALPALSRALLEVPIASEALEGRVTLWATRRPMGTWVFVVGLLLAPVGFMFLGPGEVLIVILLSISAVSDAAASLPIAKLYVECAALHLRPRSGSSCPIAAWSVGGFIDDSRIKIVSTRGTEDYALSCPWLPDARTLTDLVSFLPAAPSNADRGAAPDAATP